MRKQENNGEGAKKTKAETSYFAFFFCQFNVGRVGKREMGESCAESY